MARYTDPHRGKRLSAARDRAIAEIQERNPAAKIGQTATVLVDGEEITGVIYHVRDNGWPCVQTESGRIASGPTPELATGDERSFREMLEEHGWTLSAE